MKQNIYTIISAIILVAFFCGLIAISCADLTRIQAIGWFAIDFLFGYIGVTIGNIGIDRNKPTNA